MLSRWFQKKKPQLTGAPAVRRQKTYSAQSGYVYQYFYEGHRRAPAERAMEYVFEVSADRRNSLPVSVLLSDEAVESWESERGRALSGTERYALAKMALFQAFDERETPEAMGRAVSVTPADVRAILATLDIN
ncbi:MAG TPA: hypothetical protein VLX58_22565 [Bryobacteraceae bacterium]|nr:hypothetical protein [Bryobacteraceae bacterium]